LGSKHFGLPQINYIVSFLILFTEQTKSVTKSSTAIIAAKSIVEQINRTFSQKIQIIAE
jgi:DNA-binding protein